MQTFNFENVEKEVDECGTGRKKEHVLVRVVRKKYRCVMLFLCILVLLLQTIYLVAEKSDSQHINMILEKLPNVTKSLKKMFRLMKNRTFEDILTHPTNSSIVNGDPIEAADTSQRFNEYDTVH
jgi:hypothetical protein